MGTPTLQSRHLSLCLCRHSRPVLRGAKPTLHQTILLASSLYRCTSRLLSPDQATLEVVWAHSGPLRHPPPTHPCTPRVQDRLPLSCGQGASHPFLQCPARLPRKALEVSLTGLASGPSNSASWCVLGGWSDRVYREGLGGRERGMSGRHTCNSPVLRVRFPGLGTKSTLSKCF